MTRHHRALLCFVLLTSMMRPTIGDADDWNVWRGPHGTGGVQADGYFGDKDFGLEAVWSRALGSAYSAVAIEDGHLLTMFADQGSDYLGAFELGTGTEIWRLRLGPMYKAHDGGHDGPVSTPVADDEQVYALDPRGKLLAANLANGKEAWSVQLRERYQAAIPFWGFCTTPVLFEDLVIVVVGGKKGHGIVAFAKADGSQRWHQPFSDRVDYRSPTLTRFNGTPHFVVAGAGTTLGLDPGSGKELWRYSAGVDHHQTPLCIAENKVLLVHGGCQLIQLNENGRQPKRLWRSKELRGNSDVPVYHEGNFYGFTDRYLTCVDGKTGKRRWRSRPPGGMGLILVDGHLIVLGDKGDVVVVEANPDGYVEKARLNVSDGEAYPWPCFADGTIVVRNLKHLVALRRVPAAMVASKPEPSTGRFGQFVQQLDESDNKPELVDEFFKRHPSLPILEDDQFVHFVYRGRATDVGIRGNMLANGEEDALLPIEGTDVFYRSYEIEPGSRWQYQFVVDYDEVIPDPANPRRTVDDDHVSEVVSADWSEPDYVKAYEGSLPGRMDKFYLSTPSGRFSGPVSVYLPHSYEKDSQQHSLMLVLGGKAWIDRGTLPNTLNHLVEESIDAPIVAFVPGRGEAELGGQSTRAFAKSIATELVPELDRRYRTNRSAPARTILGHRGGAVTAVYATLRFPKVFGKCITVSYGRADTVRADLIRGLIEEGKQADEKPEFHIAWSLYDVWRPQSFDCRVQSRELAESLQQNGYRVTGGEQPGGAGWGTWRIQAGEAILKLAQRAGS